MDTNSNRLWVQLTAFGDGDLFAGLRHILQNTEDMEVVFEEGGLDVILPSDDTWRDKCYYKLVEKQRALTEKNEDVEDEDRIMFDQLMYEEEKPKLHEWNLINRPKQVICEALTDRIKKKKRPTKPPITWTVSDIAKAGCLLCCPPKETSFEDEQEMRRVYSLIYDVFRYKYVLNQALNDVRFYQAFPNVVNSAPHVWLLLFDLYHRQFEGRIEADAAIASKLFPDIGLTLVENALWTKRVKLAAAVARLRIKHNALDLAEMLPEHLRNEKVTEFSKTNPVTCWVNCYKVHDTQVLCKDIETMFNLKMVIDVKKLKENTFVWDRHCPQIIGFHSCMRDKIAKSSFVKDHQLIVQDKSFCLGPATFHKLVVDLELTGSVIQSHVNSPRTTAYLATLLARNERIKRLMAFSAGNRKNEYERYFRDLGMTNVVIFSDRLIDTPPDASYMEEVVAVFATPPNSYSAVVDPIDLVCSRGGDLSMLEVLTESGESKEAQQRVSNILDEQKKTLRFAMSRPQIQFVLYETHSALEVENTKMVEKAMTEINKVAKLHHAALQGKLFSTTQEDADSKEINNNENVDKEKLDANAPLKKVASSESQSSESEKENSESLLDKVQVPDTDVFDTPSLPKLCPSERCRNFEKEGCYLALIQRKQIIRLDDKYMIQMAEHRGLFGSNTTNASQKSKSGRTLAKKKEQKQETLEKPRKTLKDVEIDRIAAPTHTFLRHCQKTNHLECCQKLETTEEDQRVQSNMYKQWWRETTRHIMDLKKNLSLPPKPKDSINSVSLIGHEVHAVSDKTDPTERSRFQSIGVLAQEHNTRTILGMLNSAHIRQFVSPFFKQADTGTMTVLVPPVYYHQKPKPTSKPQRPSSPPLKTLPDQTTICSQRSSDETSNSSKKRSRSKKLKDIVARLSQPTQNHIMKYIKEEPETKKQRKSALEYDQRQFHCDLCRRRNSGN